MAKIYIKDGAIEGNKMMLKLDPYAEKLSARLDPWIKEYRDKYQLCINSICHFNYRFNHYYLISFLCY